MKLNLAEIRVIERAFLLESNNEFLTTSHQYNKQEIRSVSAKSLLRKNGVILPKIPGGCKATHQDKTKDYKPKEIYKLTPLGKAVAQAIESAKAVTVNGELRERVNALIDDL